MREVLAARADRDFVRAAPRRRSGAPEPSVVGRLVGSALKRPGLLVGGVAISATAAAIVVNALSFQSARHPAPIFAPSERAATPGRGGEAAPLSAPMPPARPPSVDPPAAASSATAPAPGRSAARDPIAELLRGSETTGSAGAAPQPAPAPARTEPQRLVASAQRALVKLGYGPIKTDGVLGQETRQALARFERERRLPPTGELNPRTLRELAAQSGLRIE